MTTQTRVTVSQLAAGDRFRLCFAGMEGTVVSHGPSASTVKYDGGRQITIHDRHGDAATFNQPNRAVTISSQTEVVKL